MVNKIVPILPRQNYGLTSCGGKDAGNGLDEMSVMEPRAREMPDVTTAIDKTLKKECKVNAQSWLLITLDDGANQSTFSSPHLEKHKQEILGNHVQERFRKAHDEETAGGVTLNSIPNACCKPEIQPDDLGSSRSSTPRGRRRKVRRTKERASPKTLQWPDDDKPHQAAVKDFAKEAEEADDSKPRIKNGPPGYVEDIRIRVDDTTKIEDFIRSKFNEMLQMNTKTIAKAWIKELCPAKQSKYPYNPTRPRRDGNRNAPPGVKIPPWWPVRLVRFREPDHLRMDERMELVVHLALLREYEDVPPNEPFSVVRKRACTESCVFDKPSARRSFDELLRVLERVEDYELGGIDGDTQITVSMFRRYQKSSNTSVKRGRRRAAPPLDQESHMTEQDTEPEVEGPTGPDNEADGGVTIGLPQECDPWQITSTTSSLVSHNQSQSRHKELPRNSPRQQANMLTSRARTNYELDRNFSQPTSGYPLAGDNLSPHLRRVKTVNGPLIQHPPVFRHVNYQEQDRYEDQPYLSSRSMNSYQEPFFFPPTDTVQTSGPSIQDPTLLANSGLTNRPAQVLNAFEHWESDPMKAGIDYAFMGSSSGVFSANPIGSVDPHQQTLNQASTMTCAFNTTAGQDLIKPELSDWSTQLPWDEQRSLTFRTCSGSRQHGFPPYEPPYFYDAWQRH